MGVTFQPSRTDFFMPIGMRPALPYAAFVGKMGMQQMESRLGSLEGAYLQLADRLNGIDRRFDIVHADIAELRRDVGQRFNWLTGMLLTSWVTTVLTILFHR